jgi:8-oxo-dGTP diphosphatase
MFVDVVAAVIEQDGRYLLTLRADGTHLAGHWEFPGGKVAAGESDVESLRREIREELGASIDVGERMLTTTFAYPTQTVRLHFYRCTLLDPPTALLGQEMRWVGPAELRTLPMPPGDAELIDLLTEKNPG